MEPYYCAGGVTLYLGDCIEVMRTLLEASVDAVVCDPPYGLEFMGKAWDAPWRQVAWDKRGQGAERGFNGKSRAPVGGFSEYRAGKPFQAWCEAWAREAYRVLKPGGHLVAFGGTRTHHRLVCGIEDAGFEIRDELDWMFGSGFPKSLDVSKAIDRMNGDERPIVGEWDSPGRGQRAPVQAYRLTNDHGTITSAASAASAAWEGWGTALKPAHEPICLARKPLQGTVAANVLRHGTGALNIDGTRIAGDYKWRASDSRPDDGSSFQGGSFGDGPNASGRWPANVLLDEEAAALLDATVVESVSSGGIPIKGRDTHIDFKPSIGPSTGGFGDRGGPSRFFYTAKSSRSEREAGLDDLPPALRTDGRPGDANDPRLRISERRNDHPTVKPISLMRWLVRLVTPPDGVVLDPFLGSGTTALAALDERFRIIGIDMTEHYLEVARYRISHRHLLDVKIRAATADNPQGKLL